MNYYLLALYIYIAMIYASKNNSMLLTTFHAVNFLKYFVRRRIILLFFQHNNFDYPNF